MKAPVDLSPAHLAIVERILAEHVPECEVRAFGSRATWTAKDHSDLDLAVVGEGPLPRGILARVKEAFEESRLPMRVDVLDWHAISDGFREAIESDCVVVREAVVPVGWPTVALGELVSNFDSRRIPLSRRVRSERPGPYPYYGATGVMDHVDDYIFEGLHLLVAEDGSVETPTGTPFLQLVDGQFWVNNHAHVLRGTTDEETRYLYYALFTVQVRPFMSGSVQAKLSQRNLNQIPVPYPAQESERRAIARVLGALDDKIELNRRMSATLEAMARALFRSWFVDFAPVRAKAAGRPSGLPPALDALFPASFEASELGEIPSGWGVRSLDDIADFRNGLALQRYPPDGEESLPVIKIAEMRRGYTSKTASASASIDSRYIVEDGDVLFSWSGSLELVLWSHGRGALNQHLFKVTSGEFPRWFYLGWIREHLDDFRGIAAGKATTMGHIQRHHLTDAKATVPSPDVVAAGHEVLGPLVEEQVRHAVEARTLASQRDTLLPRLVSGELRVSS